jgi:hypothetical protein
MSASGKIVGAFSQTHKEKARLFAVPFVYRYVMDQ